jgi:signal transduction histidine kinase
MGSIVFLNRSAPDSKYLKDILVKRSSNFSKRIIASVTILTVILQGIVLFGEYSETKQHLKSWLDQNMPRIEQAMFLQNTLGVTGMVSELDGSGVSGIDKLKIFSLDGSLVGALEPKESHTCEPSGAAGFSTDLLHSSLCYSAPLMFADKSFGSILIGARFDLSSLAVNLLLCVLLSLLLYGVVRWSAAIMIDELKKYFLAPLSAMIEVMGEKTMNIGDLIPVSNRREEFVGAPAEVLDLIAGYNGLVSHIQDLSTKDRQRVELLSWSKVAIQVSHDIRSPLTALRMASSKLDEVEESRKVLIRVAIQRIEEIAQTLQKKGQIGTVDCEPFVHLRPEPVTELVESLLIEKRSEYSDRPSLNIESDLKDAFGLFVEINGAEFKRHLSNIINNAAEAVDRSGSIQIIARSDNQNIEIIVRDDGCGIPNFVASKLGRTVVSYGKTGEFSGQGIGVLHAKQFAISAGGDLKISSVFGEGSEFSFVLPITTTPEWFPKQIEIRSGSSVVVVDDDPSIHEVWRKRFAATGAHPESFNFVSLYSPASFLDWLASQSSADSSDFFLIDYEFSGANKDGIDLIGELPKSNSNAVLISSRIDEAFIQRRLRAKGLRFLPKSMAQHIPVSIT